MLCDESEHFNNLDEQGEVVKFPRFNSSNPLLFMSNFTVHQLQHILIIICF